MDRAWKEIKVLLVPLLWLEAWGIAVIEAQPRGTPVISSNAGGIPEAKLGIPYIIPVNALTGKRIGFDNYIIPDQDINLGVTTSEMLMTNREEYERLPNLVRNKTVEWLRGQDHTTHEKWLMTLRRTDT